MEEASHCQLKSYSIINGLTMEIGVYPVRIFHMVKSIRVYSDDRPGMGNGELTLDRQRDNLHGLC